VQKRDDAIKAAGAELTKVSRDLFLPHPLPRRLPSVVRGRLRA
jgi:hypothetical protein